MHFIEEAAYIACRSVLPDKSKDRARKIFIRVASNRSPGGRMKKLLDIT
ncbi:unnamed protein product [Tenebrio molitor]|nr:unnamed protein product [Tenebrio molitor]